MKKIYLYLESIPLSRRRVLLLALLSMVVVPTLANLLFTSDSLKALFENQLYLFGLGLIVYLSWLWFLFYLKKKDNLQWKHLSLSTPEIVKGLLLGLAVYVIVNTVIAVTVVLKGSNLTLSSSFSSLEGILTALGLFAFNIFLSAFIEEVLNRAYLIPQAYRLLHLKIKFKAVALFLSILLTQLLFVLAHLPRDVFRFGDDLSTIINRYEQLLLSGIVYALVYLRTRNVIFLSMYHAFLNYGLPLVNSDAYLKVHYNFVVLLVLVFWNKIMKTKQPEVQLDSEPARVKVA